MSPEFKALDRRATLIILTVHSAAFALNAFWIWLFPDNWYTFMNWMALGAIIMSTADYFGDRRRCVRIQQETEAFQDRIEQIVADFKTSHVPVNQMQDIVQGVVDSVVKQFIDDGFIPSDTKIMVKHELHPPSKGLH